MKLLRLTTLLALSLTLAACGGGKKPSESSSTPASEESVSTPVSEESIPVEESSEPEESIPAEESVEESIEETLPVEESSEEAPVSEEESVPTEESEPAEESSEDTPAPSGAVTVRFWHTFGDKVETALEKRVEKFEKLVKDNEGVDVNVELSYQGAYTDMVNKVTLGFSGGDSPTIAVAYPDHVAEYLYLEDTPGKYVVNMNKYIESDTYGFGKEAYLGDGSASDFIEAFYQEGFEFSREGMYLMPFMKSSEVMIYNLDAAKRAMKFYRPAVPDGKVKETIANMTWDELIELGEAAVDNKAEVSNTLEYPIYYDSDSNLFISKLLQNEISYSGIDSNGKGYIGFENDPDLSEAKDFVQSLKDAHDYGVLTTKGTEGEYASNAFQSGKCLFTIGSSGGAGYTFPAFGEFETAICAVPASNDNPLYVSQGPSLTLLNRPELTKAENDLATLYGFKLLKYLTSTQVNVEMCITGSQGYVPVRESCYETEVYAEFIEEGELYAETASVLLNDIDGNYLTTKCFKGSAALRTNVGGIISAVLTGTTTIDVAFTNAINNTRLEIK